MRRRTRRASTDRHLRPTKPKTGIVARTALAERVVEVVQSLKRERKPWRNDLDLLRLQYGQLLLILITNQVSNFSRVSYHEYCSRRLILLLRLGLHPHRSK